MEFVSRKQMVRSAQYCRPVVKSERHSPAQSSAFSVQLRQPIKKPASAAPVPVHHSYSVQQQAHAASPTVAPQPAVVKVKPQQHTAPALQHTAPRTQPTSVTTHAAQVAAVSTVASPNVPEAPTGDISSLFESVQLDVVAPVKERSKKVVRDDSDKVSRSMKRRVFSAALFTAALVGTVAMGYDLFVAPHPKPNVSYVSSNMGD